jgi:pectate lyase
LEAFFMATKKRIAALASLTLATASIAAGAALITNPASAAPATVHGYATVNGSTTGGGSTSVTVTSLSALTTAAKASTAQTVLVNGNFSCSADVTVTSNKTIRGVGSDSGLTGCGLKINGVSNVIIQNLKIAKVDTGTKDAIHLEESDHVWIDHNDLSSDMDNGNDYYDGLIDATHAVDYLTISNNYLHDHYKGILIGHSDDNASEDTGKLHVTVDHNYFKNINSRTPSLRFGTGHVYNNYFVTGSTGAHSRMGAQMLVQNNVFSGVGTPIQDDVDSDEPGHVNESGNDFGTGTNKITNGIGSFTSAPYSVTLEAISGLASSVPANAGTGKI